MTNSSLGVRLLLRSSNMFENLAHLVRAAISGWWLGLLRGESLDPLATFPYDTLDRDGAEDFNQTGLQFWERRSIDEFFQDCRTLLLAGAGGGREALALRRRGFDVDGFDFMPQLVNSANDLLEDEGFPSTIELVSYGECPQRATTLDGAVLGRCCYMLIRGRARRVAFLSAVRSQLCDGAPLFLAFHDRNDPSRRFRLTCRLANALRWLLRRPDRVELGDHIDPESGFVHHHFTQHEIASELRDAGFELLRFSTVLFPHAVGRAVPSPSTHRELTLDQIAVVDSTPVAAN